MLETKKAFAVAADGGFFPGTPSPAPLLYHSPASPAVPADLVGSSLPIPSLAGSPPAHPRRAGLAWNAGKFWVANA